MNPHPPRYILPPDAYRSHSWFDRELDSLFTHQWCLVGASADVERPGDYVTATIGRAPVVVMRGADGALRAFHNLCRHRGMVMLQGAGNAGKSINCFYHQWRYSTEGALEVVPQRRDQFPDIDLDCWGLLPAAVGEWEGMVFAHPDPDARPLADAIGGVSSGLGTHRPGQLEQLAHVQITARCNWKLLVENHVDVYHLWYLHEQSLAGFDHTRFEHHQHGSDWVSYEPQREGAPAGPVAAASAPTIRHLTGRDTAGLGAHLLFPSLMMASSPEFFATYAAVPVAPDETVLDLRVRGEADADAVALTAAVRSFIDEDVRACEAVQAAMASPAFAVGPLARDHEAPIAEFQSHVLAAVGR